MIHPGRRLQSTGRHAGIPAGDRIGVTHPVNVDTWHGYRGTLDSLLEGFQIIAHDWTYLYVNPAAAKHGQRSPEELQGRRMWEAYPGIEETPLFATLQQCMRERTATAFENLFTLPDGTARWFEIRVEPVPEGICVHSVDIQRRKEAETALREQENVVTMGRMAAVVAHEVRNPLAGLSGALQVFRSRRRPEDPEVPILGEMLQCISTLERLIQDLLIFAKPMQLDARPVAIAEVVRHTLSLLENDQRLARHSVTVAGDDDPIVVLADQNLLKNVFRNLLLNAAQAMAEPGSIAVRIVSTGRECRVTVADTGPGIPPGLSTRIFEPFVTGKHEGSGLGLAISRRILRLHGGELSLLPAAPGATFLATIPIDTVDD
jgi:PAS domain S-box-containing protein